LNQPIWNDIEVKLGIKVKLMCSERQENCYVLFKNIF